MFPRATLFMCLLEGVRGHSSKAHGTAQNYTGKGRHCYLLYGLYHVEGKHGTVRKAYGQSQWQDHCRERGQFNLASLCEEQGRTFVSQCKVLQVLKHRV